MVDRYWPDGGIHGYQGIKGRKLPVFRPHMEAREGMLILLEAFLQFHKTL